MLKLFSRSSILLAYYRFMQSLFSISSCYIQKLIQTVSRLQLRLPIVVIARNDG